MEKSEPMPITTTSILGSEDSSRAGQVRLALLPFLEVSHACFLPAIINIQDYLKVRTCR